MNVYVFKDPTGHLVFSLQTWTMPDTYELLGKLSLEVCGYE
jgi:hypothetical protein